MCITSTTVSGYGDTWLTLFEATFWALKTYAVFFSHTNTFIVAVIIGAISSRKKCHDSGGADEGI